MTKEVKTTFVFDADVGGPLFLELQGVRRVIPMVASEHGWTAIVILRPGTYLYRFRIADSLFLNDHRRSTQRVVESEFWSIVQVSESGPVWVERRFPIVSAVHACRAVNEAEMPVMILDKVRAEDFPIVVWIDIQHLFNTAFLHVFLINPLGDLAFASECVLAAEGASTTFGYCFWFSVDLKSDDYLLGKWRLIVRTEGSTVSEKDLWFE